VEVEVDLLDARDLVLEAHQLEHVGGVLDRVHHLLVEQGALQGLEVLLEREALADRLLQPQALVLAAREQGNEVGLDVLVAERARAARELGELGAYLALDAAGHLDGGGEHHGGAPHVVLGLAAAHHGEKAQSAVREALDHGHVAHGHCRASPAL